MRNPLLAITCACLLGILTAACGSEDSQPDASRSAGGPRLAWDQFAPGVEELRRYSFVLYVDGSPVPLPGATCGALAPDTPSAQCTSPLPALTAGQHTLELATRVTENGIVIESARSASIAYTVGSTGFASGTAGARAAIPGAGSGSPPGDTSSGTGQATGESPFIVETVVTGLDSPSALARLPDGRLLIAERRGLIRIAEGGVLRPEPAAELPGADFADDARVSLAVAPDFAASGHVYVAYAALDAEGARTGLVVRFRETGGTLGELAVVIDRLPAELAAPSLLIGPDGMLHVATSALDAEESADLSWYAGKVLRFSPDGTAPADNPMRSSPVFSSGYRSRFDLDRDPVGGSLWHVDTAASGATLGRSEAGRQAVRTADLGSIRPAGMAFYAGEALPEWRGSLFIALPDEHCVLRVSGLSASPPNPVVERVLSGFGRIVAVLSAPDGLYVATAASAAFGEGTSAGAVHRVRDQASGR